MKIIYSPSPRRAAQSRLSSSISTPQHEPVVKRKLGARAALAR
jgi:hypothetical protein